MLGNRTAVVDPLTNRFVFERDALGRVVVEMDPFGLSRRHRYDAAGNRIETVDRNGRKRTFDYDAQNRMVAESWHDPITDAVIVTNSLSYDLMGRITELRSPEAVILVSYLRETDRAVQEWITYPGLPVRLVGLRRDELGRLESVNPRRSPGTGMVRFKPSSSEVPMVPINSVSRSMRGANGPGLTVGVCRLPNG